MSGNSAAKPVEATSAKARARSFFMMLFDG